MTKYTESQAVAIGEIERHLQIIACAGSGKTQVISARAVEILKRKRNEGIKPENVVAFTFTDKAAAELKDRIATLVRAELGELPGMAEMYVGTIHGYCLHLLQTYLFEYLKFTVLNDVQTRLLVARNSRKSGLADVQIISGPSTGQNLKRSRQDVSIFIDALNILREDNVPPDQLPDPLVSARDKYADLLKEHRQLDYSQIMAEAIGALYAADPACRKLQETLAGRVKFLVVDEYQDVNPLQEALVSRLQQLGANVCVVGDDDQTIYQWRGSEIRNILEFAGRYPEVRSVTLAENFRSSPGVVTTGRLVAEQNDPERLPKAMVAAGHQAFDRGDLLALTFNDPDEEAAWIAHKILALRGVPFVDEPEAAPRGLSWSDCAILLRSVRRNGEPITRALKAAGIPYVIGGLTNLFDSLEIAAAVRVFEYVVGQADEAALRAAWFAADLGLNDADLNAGREVLDKARSWIPGERWGAYNIQRTYLNFLEAIGLREERIPPTSAGASQAEIVYFNLGKFSQVISDFELIWFQSEPKQKYEQFVWWLNNDAPDYYEEGGEDKGFAQPDAVQIMTVHQAKGMEWPAVFLPALQKNRFPSTAGGKGRSKWHILPRAAVPDAARYEGSVADERRLFYVAITRSKKYLFCSFAPTPGNQLYKRPSRFMQEFTRSTDVLTRDMPLAGVRIGPRPKRETPNVVLSFSELKYFFECPYQFKLRFLYGFNPPLHEALGYGKSLHDALAEVHKRALEGDLVDDAEVEKLVDTHLNAPFAPPTLREQLRGAALKALARYLKQYGPTLRQTTHSEQQVEIQVAPGITVNGRIDLIKRLDTNEVAIVDFKSSERAQAEDVTRAQLHTYAIGYRQLTGGNADLVEVLNLDEAGKNVRELVDGGMLSTTEAQIRKAGASIRENQLTRIESWCKTCAGCDLAGICRKREG
ncbi:MAG: ATP-dependent helicase [Polyangiaceae bacterium]